jgi:predicted dehydrogenase
MKLSKPLKVACIGAGYFSKFHIDAWCRIPEVQLVAICDQDIAKAKEMANSFGITKTYQAAEQLLNHQQVDVVDVITPPETHTELCRLVASHKKAIICQKPVAPTFREAVQLVNEVSDKVPFYIHENYRFQPWYRKIKSLISDQLIGDRLHTLYVRTRMGDGWQPDAYLQRQPYFRTMPRLLVHETGVHFIDTFRYLLGEVESVYADLRKLNADIAGEDCGMLYFKFKNGVRAVWDANRYNQSTSSDPRYTFGELLLEGNGGSIRLYHDGSITLQKLGEKEVPIDYHHENRNFGSDCVYHTQLHLTNSLLGKAEAENLAIHYLENLKIQEAIYQSASESQEIKLVENE